MAAFEYQALNAQGRSETGVIAADSARQARQALRLRQLTPLDVKPASAPAQQKITASGRIKESVRTTVMRQLAALLSAGVPVESALSAAAEDAPAPARRGLLAVREDIAQGARLSQAAAHAPGLFPPLVRAVITSGEQSGQLGTVLDRLAGQMERSYRLKQKVQAALVYPAFLFIMALVMVVAMLVFIVPKLVSQFEQAGSELPLLTRIVVALSDALRTTGAFWLAGLAVLIFVLMRVRQLPAFQAAGFRVLTRLPMMGAMLKTASAAQFSRVFATLLGAGASALDALASARAATADPAMRAAASQIAESIRTGGGFAAALKETRAFPPIVSRFAQAGEAGRDLPGLMERAADQLDADFEARATTLMSLLEPTIILLLGLLIGLIVLAVMLPILQLNTLAAQ